MLQFRRGYFVPLMTLRSKSFPSLFWFSFLCLRRFIVEQQYQKAVAVVIKTRSYVEGLKKLKSQNPDQYRSPLSSSASSAPTGLEKALLALEFVNERAAHLASTIKKSLTLLPNSPVSHLRSFVAVNMLIPSPLPR